MAYSLDEMEKKMQVILSFKSGLKCKVFGSEGEVGGRRVFLYRQA